MVMRMSSVHDPRREQLIGLLQLPSHLQKTMKAILELGEATAEGIAEKTGRVRATESDYLNQLERTGLVKRRWQGRTVRFSPMAPRETVLKVIKLLRKRGYSEKAINEIMKWYL